MKSAKRQEYINYIKRILPEFKYMIFDIKNPIGFKIKYLTEKTISYPIFFTCKILNKNCKGFFLFKKDYIIKNNLGIWKIKAKTDYDYIISSCFEKELQEEFKKTKGIFIDIGTHIGKWSIYTAKYSKAEKIYSFEPSKINFKYLKTNIKLNKIEDKIELINKGVSSKKGEISFFFDNKKTGCSGVSEKGNTKIEVITLDSFIKQRKIDINKISLIKIDVEGHEFEVLKGMKNFLKETNNTRIICELIRHDDDKEVFDLMKECGFTYKLLKTNVDYMFYKKR